MVSESGLNGRRQAMTEDEAERRRYALLQAATRVYIDNFKPCPAEASDIVNSCVDIAEELLAEIERREEAEPER